MNQSTVERQRLFQELTDCAARAFSCTGVIEKAFRIQGRCFVMRFADEFMATTMSRALNHLAINAPKEIELTIDCWDSTGTGTSFPMPEWPDHLFLGRGEVRGLDSPEMRIAYFDWIKLLNVYFPEKAQAFYCMASANPFPVQQFGSPALTIFNWWLGTHGWQFTHAAAVGTERGGVLIAGYGGAGKSTLSFSTLGTPLHYVSDDYCVLVPGKPLQAVALYNSGKLTETSLGLLEHLRPHAANVNDSLREKAVFFLSEQFPSDQILQTPLRAVVLSHLNPTETFLEPIAWREILSVLAKSSMGQLAGSNHEDFLRMMRLIQGLPTYRLHHGSDSLTTHRLLLQLCAS